MALGNFTILEQNTMTGRGGRLYNIAAGSTIYAGEPVGRLLGGINVFACINGAGVVGTDYVVGVATTTSTATASVAGTVDVMPLSSGITYLVAPAVAASWDTQAEYDALVGKRVTINLTTGVYTVNASDSANNGLIVMPLDISKYPGKVAVAFRAALSDVA